jgi:hypothetical protein
LPLLLRFSGMTVSLQPQLAGMADRADAINVGDHIEGSYASRLAMPSCGRWWPRQAHPVRTVVKTADCTPACDTSVVGTPHRSSPGLRGSARGCGEMRLLRNVT